MRLHGKVDSNQRDIVKALRKVGASVQSLASIGKGCPDILVGFRGQNYLMEIKRDGESKFTKDQCNWSESWRGRYFRVETIKQALDIILSF